jgi:anti-sigma factor RsiW
MTQGCARWRDDLAALVLGALDGEDRAAMKTHLAACPACRAAYQELVPVRDWLTRTRQHLVTCRECRAYYEDLVYPQFARQVVTGRETQSP